MLLQGDESLSFSFKWLHNLHFKPKICSEKLVQIAEVHLRFELKTLRNFFFFFFFISPCRAPKTLKSWCRDWGELAQAVLAFQPGNEMWSMARSFPASGSGGKCLHNSSPRAMSFWAKWNPCGRWWSWILPKVSLQLNYVLLKLLLMRILFLLLLAWLSEGNGSY